MSRSAFNIAPLWRRGGDSASASSSSSSSSKKKKNKYVKPYSERYARINRLHLASSTSDPVSERVIAATSTSATSSTSGSESAALAAIYAHLRHQHRLATTSTPTPTTTDSSSIPIQIPLAHVRLVTSHGHLNLELYPGSAPRATHTFLRLCSTGAYDSTPFHRLIPGFMIQGGKVRTRVEPYGNEIDAGGRIRFDSRGVVGMANTGAPNTNGSQFFITFAAAGHLDGKHSIIGRVVGGGATLDRMESSETRGDDVPIDEVKIVRAVVFSDVFQVLWRKWRGVGLGSDLSSSTSSSSIGGGGEVMRSRSRRSAGVVVDEEDEEEDAVVGIGVVLDEEEEEDGEGR